MPEWLENLFIAIGGGTIVMIGVLTIFKRLLIKLFETGIESSFERNLELFRNKLSRSTKAYEILLEREMRFYEKLEPITAELVPLEHDLLFYLRYNKNINHTGQCEAFKKHFQRYCELIVELKNENLIHQSYITPETFNAYTIVIKQMQDDISLWYDMAKLLFASEYNKIDYKKCEMTVDSVLIHLAFAEDTVRRRLKYLSGENE